MGDLGARASRGSAAMKDAKEKFIALNLKIEEVSPMKSSLDVIKNNRAFSSLAKICKYFDANREKADCILSKLLEHENNYVRIGAASHCLALGIKTERALEVLNDIAQNATIRYEKGKAEGVLMAYEQQGYLIIYQGQEIHRPEQKN